MNKKTLIVFAFSSLLVLLFVVPLVAGSMLPNAVSAQPVLSEAANGTSLSVCLGDEPDNLYFYTNLTNTAFYDVLESIFDGPIDTRGYEYQPVILEKIPSLDDGDVVINPITVKQGDTVVDAYGNVAALTPGLSVIPAGQTDPIDYTGGDIDLDQMAVTFALLPGLMWSDGTQLTAADSVYSFELASDPDTPNRKTLEDRTDSYTALDNLTVKWTGLPGYIDATFPDNFWTPLPEHLWGTYSALELLTADVSSRTPVGWGAYIIDEWVDGDHISLSKNPNYFRKDEGLPPFDSLVFRFVDADTDALVAALISGECDVVHAAALDLETVLEEEQQGKINTVHTTGTVWEHMDFGIQHVDYDNGYDGGNNDRPDFFSDKRVRHAFAYCADRQEVVDSLMSGLSEVIDVYIPPEHPLYNANIASYSYEPSKGKALLEAVGWKDGDGDGIREAHSVPGVPDGTKFEVTYATTSNTLRQQTVQILSQSLMDCGIKANPSFDGDFWGDTFGREFDLAEFAWVSDFNPPCNLFSSEQVPGPEDGDWVPILEPSAGPLSFPFGWEGQNNPGYYNPAYDQACWIARASIPGQDAYVVNHREAQRIFAEDLPVLPLYNRVKISATRLDVAGVVLDPTETAETWNIESYGRYAVSGKVQNSSGDPLSNVMVEVSSGALIPPTSSNVYTFTTAISGTYTLTPTLTGTHEYVFYPPVRTVTLPPSETGMDFVAAHDDATIDPGSADEIAFQDPGDMTVSLQVPENSVTEETTLLYTQVHTVTEPGFAGVAFGLSAYQNGEHLENFTFETPVTVRLDYDEQILNGMDERYLLLFTWTGTDWEDAACGAYERHLDENWLSVPICHLSKFALSEFFNKVFLPYVVH